jgi:hypothetical protein
MYQLLRNWLKKRRMRYIYMLGSLKIFKIRMNLKIYINYYVMVFLLDYLIMRRVKNIVRDVRNDCI